MILLIDGYNLLRSVFPGPKVSATKKQQFLSELRRYEQLKGHWALVVFDAGPSDWVYKDKENGIHVVYSGVQQTADDYIKKYIKEHRDKDILLVSSDRELRDCAKRYKFESIGAYSFYQRMIQSLKTGSSSEEPETDLIKLTEDSDVDLDELMRQASEKIQLKREDRPIEDSRRPSAQKLSKEERKRLKKLGKL